jgi:hypothetical protein
MYRKRIWNILVLRHQSALRLCAAAPCEGLLKPRYSGEDPNRRMCAVESRRPRNFTSWSAQFRPDSSAGFETDGRSAAPRQF